MKKFLEKLTNTASVITVISYIEYIWDQNKRQEINSKIEAMKAKEAELDRKAALIQKREYELQDIESTFSGKLASAKGEINDNFSNINKSWAKLQQILSDTKTNIVSMSEQDKTELLNSRKSQILYELDEINRNKTKCDLKLGDILKALEELKKNRPSGSNSSNNFIGSDNFETIKILIDNYKEFLSQLTFEQYGAVVHIITSIAILTSLFNIIIIIYSEFLINYFKIEDKYPKLSRYLKIRKTFQHLSLFWNILFIVLTLLAIIYINFKLFSLDR